MTQLVPCFSSMQAVDHICHACNQVYNLPVHPVSWLICTLLISVGCCTKLLFSSYMERPGAQMPQIPEDSYMYEAFGQMSQAWEMFTKAKDVENATKRHRKGEPPAKRPGAGQAGQIMQAMGNLLLKLDAERQVRLMDMLHANRQPSSPAPTDGPSSPVEEITVLRPRPCK